MNLDKPFPSPRFKTDRSFLTTGRAISQVSFAPKETARARYHHKGLPSSMVVENENLWHFFIENDEPPGAGGAGGAGIFS